MRVTTIGIDLAKNVFREHGVAGLLLACQHIRVQCCSSLSTCSFMRTNSLVADTSP